MLPVEERRRLVAAYEASGMTMAEFARREGINYSTLAGWMYRKGQNERGVNAGAIEFAQVHLPGASALCPPAIRGELEVRLPDGTQLRAGRVADLVALVRALRG